MASDYHSGQCSSGPWLSPGLVSCPEALPFIIAGRRNESHSLCGLNNRHLLLTILEAWSPKSRCQQGHASSELGRGVPLCLLLASGHWSVMLRYPPLQWHNSVSATGRGILLVWPSSSSFFKRSLLIFFNIIYYYYYLATPCGVGPLVPWPGVKPESSALEVQRVNH